ncbi:Imidazole glycerol phosphate synthase subunit HisF [compost metagenome]
MKMNKTRVIPVLLMLGEGLVKTIKFGNPKYIGDPINAVRIFNEKEVDELVFLDVEAGIKGEGPKFDLLSDIAEEAFMPMAYGGGISTLDQIKRLFGLGFEKVIINSIAYRELGLIKKAAAVFGSQSIVGAVDVRYAPSGEYELYSSSGRVREHVSLSDHLVRLTDAGVGEILINSIDRDGTLSGYDLALLKRTCSQVSVPVVACGGAGGIRHFVEAVEEAHVSAVAAGSLFVFVGPHRAVLITYPDRDVLTKSLP